MKELEEISRMVKVISDALTRLAFNDALDVDTSLLLENLAFDSYKMSNEIKELSYIVGGE